MNTTIANRVLYLLELGIDCLVVKEATNDRDFSVWSRIRCVEDRIGSSPRDSVQAADDGSSNDRI